MVIVQIKSLMPLGVFLTCKDTVIIITDWNLAEKNSEKEILLYNQVVKTFKKVE